MSKGGFLLGKIIERLGLPGLVQPVQLIDPEIGTITIKTSQFYTTISIEGTDFFFDRESGRYDGWGRGLKKPTQPADCTGDRIQESSPVLVYRGRPVQE